MYIILLIHCIALWESCLLEASNLRERFLSLLLYKFLCKNSTVESGLYLWCPITGPTVATFWNFHSTHATGDNTHPNHNYSIIRAAQIRIRISVTPVTENSIIHQLLLICDYAINKCWLLASSTLTIDKKSGGGVALQTLLGLQRYQR